MIVNDDISIDPDAFAAAIRRHLSKDNGIHEIVYFDEDKLRTIPRRSDVFLQVSLIGKLLGRYQRTTVPKTGSYRSFSCVAISRELFEKINGFDEDLVFTYEDADFVARAIEFGAVQKCATEGGVIHAHSVSSGRHVDRVLPVATYSAARYLDKRSGSFIANTIVIIFALAFRVLFVPFTRAKKINHLRGIFSSALAVARRSQHRPNLPDYTTL
jgi:GT2 family glycosyltransferase